MKSGVQFVTDAQGNKTGFILPPEEFEAFIDYLEDRDIAEAARKSLAEEEETIPWEQVKAELKAEARLGE